MRHRIAKASGATERKPQTALARRHMTTFRRIGPPVHSPPTWPADPHGPPVYRR